MKTIKFPNYSLEIAIILQDVSGDVVDITHITREIFYKKLGGFLLLDSTSSGARKFIDFLSGALESRPFQLNKNIFIYGTLLVVNKETEDFIELNLGDFGEIEKWKKFNPGIKNDIIYMPAMDGAFGYSISGNDIKISYLEPEYKFQDSPDEPAYIIENVGLFSLELNNILAWISSLVKLCDSLPAAQIEEIKFLLSSEYRSHKFD